MLRRILQWGVGTALFIPAAGMAQSLDYPYAVAFQTVRLVHTPVDETKLESGALSARLNLRWINVWSLQDERFLIDGEEFQAGTTLRYQLSERLQFGGSAVLIGHGGGSLDRMIEWFHRTTGVTQGQRDRYPRDRFNVSYEPYGPYYPLLKPPGPDDRGPGNRSYPRSSLEPPVEFSDQLRVLALASAVPEAEEIAGAGITRTGVGDPNVFAQLLLYESADWLERVNLGLNVKFAGRGAEQIVTPGTDVTASLSAGQAWIPGLLHSSLGVSYTHYRLQRYRELELPPGQWVVRPRLELRLNQITWFGEYVYFSRPVLDFGELSRDGHQVALGLVSHREQVDVTFAIVENFVTFGVTPDIGFQVSAEWRAL
ncbi:MAG: DUF3187 family protein [Spirochaetales bacterium]|nr:DUF3187 family protein [Leptospiraceae bacterium]MCP5482375.1 DUF3187 family protein [Spirochaetales bacterium]MCP5484186.1 DUF3187 family protein [Spirochaetales bacterium]